MSSTTSKVSQESRTVTVPIAGQRRLNWRLLIGSIVTLVVLGPALYTWHLHQLTRVADALLARADGSERDGEPGEAANYLYRYLQMIPADQPSSEIITRLAVLYDESITEPSKKDSVIQWYYRALGVAPDRLDLRNRLGELFLETKQFVLAQTEAETCLEYENGNLEAERIRALARFGQYHQGRPLAMAEVLTELEAVRDRDPANLAVAQALVSLYRKTIGSAADLDRAQQADRVMDEMVRSNPDQKQAHLARYRYRLHYGLPGASEDLLRAMAADPEGTEVILTAANDARRRGAFQDAEQLFRRVVQRTPNDVRGYIGLGDALWFLDKGEAAIEIWEQAIEVVDAGQLSLLVRVADAQIQLDQRSQARITINRIGGYINRLVADGRETQRAWAVESKELLQAKLKIAEGEFDEAISMLRRITTTATTVPGMSAENSTTYQAWLLLGRTYARLQRWEDAANSYERSMAVWPRSNEARLWAARAWNRIGRRDRAIMLCEQATEQPHASETIWIMLCELQMRDQLSRPAAERDWVKLRKTMQTAREAMPQSWEIQLLQATELIASQPPNYRQLVLPLLREAESVAEDSVSLWTRLIFLYDALDKTADADRALARVGRLSDDPSLLKLYTAVLHARRGEYQESEAALGEIGTPPENLQAAVDRVRLMLAYRQGDHDAARRVLYQRLERDPSQADILAQLTELAVFDQSWTEADRLVEKLRESEGADGVLWRFFRAQRLLESAPSVDSREVADATELMNEIRTRRPWWTGSYLLRARLAELSGEDDTAITGYANVLRAGLKQGNVYLRLVRLLHKQGRFTEADEWMQQLQEHQPLDPQFLDLAWSSAPDRDRLQLALHVGRKNIELHPSEAVARIWMAQMLLLAGRDREAQVLIAEAEQLKPTDSASWTGLLSFYLRAGDQQKAYDALAILQHNDEVPLYQRHWIAAQAYRQLGRPELAAEAYVRALQLEPNRDELQIDFARYLRPFDSSRAESILREVIRRSPHEFKARQLLATWLHWTPNQQSHAEATRLLTEADFADTRDLRLDATLRMRRGGENDLSVAREILEQLVADHHRTEDRRMLAQLCDRQGDTDAARRHWRKLAERPEPSSRDLAGFIDFLLRTDQLESAGQWLEKLDSLSLRSFPAFSLRVRLMIQSKQVRQLEAFVADYVRARQQDAKRPAVEQRLFQQVAELLESLDQLSLAEKWFQRLAEQFPEQEELLALYWVRHGELDRAVQLCDRRTQELPVPDKAVMFAKVLILGSDTSSLIAQYRDRLTDILAAHPDSAELNFAMSNLSLKEGDSDRAAQLLRELTELRPHYVLAWNNLAAILADREEARDEAMASINQAISVAGRPVAILLDTKAVLLLQAGESADAAYLLQQAVALPDGADPRFHFHLAVAQERLGELTGASQSWRRALELGIDQAFLTEYERRWMADFQSQTAIEEATTEQHDTATHE